MIPHDINPFNSSKMLFISSDIAHDARRFHFVMIMSIHYEGKEKRNIINR